MVNRLGNVLVGDLLRFGRLASMTTPCLMGFLVSDISRRSRPFRYSALGSVRPLKEIKVLGVDLEPEFDMLGHFGLAQRGAGFVAVDEPVPPPYADTQGRRQGYGWGSGPTPKFAVNVLPDDGDQGRYVPASAVDRHFHDGDSLKARRLTRTGPSS